MSWTIPNILTVARVLAAPGVAVVFALFARPLADLLALALFIGASATDWLDGRLARLWAQESTFGKMLDPIADKAMVMISLAVLSALAGVNWLILVPVAVIFLREIVISGLREFLAGAISLPVTTLAKWKTTAQMCAIAVLLFAGYADHRINAIYFQMTPETFEAAVSGAGADPLGAGLWFPLADWTAFGGYVLLWVAALLTFVTGWDYMAKGLGYLRTRESG